MEHGLERRIKNVLVKLGNKLWITLYQDFSMVDNHLYRCINKWIESIKKKYGFRAVVTKMDVKIDYRGSYYYQTQHHHQSLLAKALKDSFAILEEGEAVSFDSDFDNNNIQIKSDKGTKTFTNFKIYLNKTQCFRFKSYDKLAEIFQKETVGKQIGTRFG